MAGIDITYTNSYKEYKEFKEWAEDKVVIFFDGLKKHVKDWVYRWEEEDFYGQDLPVINTPQWLDAYLIQNCKVPFIVERLKEIYSPEHYDLLKNTDLSAPPSPDYKQNRKVVIVPNEYTKYPLRKRTYSYLGRANWWVQNKKDLRYNNETKKWVSRSFLYPTYTNTFRAKSIKAIIRHLRKQYLPKDAEFNLTGNYVGEEYTIKIK